MRMRSPSTAPPLKGLVGSTATMPTRWPAARNNAVTRSVSVDFPAPGGPVIPITCARPVWGWSRLISAGSAGARFSTSVIRRARATRSPPSMRSMRSCSLTREPRGALLDERRHALAHVGGREEPSLSNSLIFHDRLQCGSEARVQIRLDRLQGERRAEQRVVHARPIAQKLLGGRPLLPRHARSPLHPYRSPQGAGDAALWRR